MNITLKQLKVFLAIVNHDNMTAAAHSINMTKGALSQSLAELESQLATQLFDRRNSRLYLNQSGAHLIPLADELLTRMTFIENEFKLNTTSPKIKIGCTKSIGSFFLPHLLKTFEDNYGWLPDILIDNAHSIHQSLNRFELDLALVETSILDASLDSEFWRLDKMIVVASRHHPLTHATQVSYEQLNQERWILREPNSASRQFFETQLANQFTQPIHHLTLNAFDAILLCVINNLGITFITKECLNHPLYAEHLRPIKLPDNYLRNFNIVHPHTKFISPAMQQFIDFIKEHTMTE